MTRDWKTYRYNPSTPRAALGSIAVAMSAITFGIMVLIPARLESRGVDDVPRANGAGDVPIDVATVPAQPGALEAAHRAMECQPDPAASATQDGLARRHKSSSRGRSEI